jgi:NAD(P)-dependent dehydrogenase (short-subunit alcohol dehydrogenase family)
MEDFAGKTAFITGGAGGMGVGMAEAFAGAGVKVVLADIRQDGLDAARTALAAHGPAIHTVRFDVTDRAAWVRAADEVEATVGPIDLLVNNAGVMLIGPMEQATYPDWDFMLGITLGGAINGIQTFVPRMIARGKGGHIVNTSSTSGLFASWQCGVYITAKYALAGLSEALRSDLEKYGIGVSAFFPGPANTDFGRNSQAVRPPELAASGYERRGSVSYDASLLMGPREIGARVLRGVRRNDAFIMTHPEFREGMQARHEALIRALPDEPPNEARRELLTRFPTMLHNPIYDAQTTPGPMSDQGD